MRRECSWCEIQISLLRAAANLIDKECKDCAQRSALGGNLGPKYAKGSRKGQKQ